MFPEIIPIHIIQKSIDNYIENIVTNHADKLDTLSQPILKILLYLEHLICLSPWWFVIIFTMIVAWFASHQIKLSITMGILLCIIGFLGLWDASMQTLTLMIIIIVLLALIGIPLGILMARIKWLRTIMLPILDIMQTMPSFVYLIPVVMLFGLGKIPAIIATIIYSVPPLIRLTDLGIRLVDNEVLEAAKAFGANATQQLFGVQLPLALPSIMAGLNQSTMMALSMVVVASMIGTRGLGYEVLLGLNRQEAGRGLLAGLAIAILAMLFDRITQSYGKRIHREV